MFLFVIMFGYRYSRQPDTLSHQINVVYERVTPSKESCWLSERIIKKIKPTIYQKSWIKKKSSNKEAMKWK